MTNSLRLLGAQGQAVWLDYLHQDILQNRELKRSIEQDGLTGLTSNPSIFEKAIGGGNSYDARLKAILAAGDCSIMALYEQLAIADIQGAADQFRPVYDRLNRQDGYVSLEVSPYLAMDTEATIAEARRLWRAVDRPNLMIKVPGTKAGVPAIRQLIGEGINVNVILLFAVDAYLDVAEAYMAGLEALKSTGGDLSKTHSVASFFLSRIDVAMDKEIDDKNGGSGDGAHQALRGKVAIASAKVAYQDYLEIIATPRWKQLAASGALPQRLLWASTSTKDPEFSDVLYVCELIGRDTVNTMPPKTMDAFRDHGEVRPSLTEAVEDARAVLAQVETSGLNLKRVTDALVRDGVRLFSNSFDALLAAVATKRAKMLGGRLNTQQISAPAPIESAQRALLERARAEGWQSRLWAKDASLWTGADEAQWLGWLSAGHGGAVDLKAFAWLQAEVKVEGFTHVLLMGMGGSSLGAEVFAKTFAAEAGFPKLLIINSTDPDEIARIEGEIDIARTLFIVSSKSGSTLEPNILHDYFFARATDAVHGGKAGAHFIAITDPGSPLEDVARRDEFRHIFHGDPEIGGRYSVLSNFGMVPAALTGLDVGAFLERTRFMTRACGADAPPAANPGFQLGALLGAAALAGRDKVTIFAAEPIADFGAWLEQLLAESTGKHGKGLIPVNDEPLGVPGVYGADRVFVALEMEGQDDSARAATLSALEKAGHPIVRISVADKAALGQEFFRWEMAVAVAGAVMQLNPFDQPDVEASKVKARALTDAYEKSGTLAAETPILKSDGMTLYANSRNAEALAQLASSKTLDAYLSAHLKRAHDGDYVGLLAYLDRNPEHRPRCPRGAASHSRQAQGRNRRRLRTALSALDRASLQGGPNSGVFLEMTGKPSRDTAIPRRKASFAIVEAAQARGDAGVWPIVAGEFCAWIWARTSMVD